MAPNMMAADIRVTGSSLQAGVPQTLFGADNPNATVAHPAAMRFAVSADGKNFLISQPGTGGPTATGGLADQIAAVADRGGVSNASAAGVTVVLNWPQMLKKK